LSQRAVETLRFWAQRFPDREPEHFVFPHERYGGCGTEEIFGFTRGAVYDSDATRPTGGIKVAWGQARKRARLENVRIHDLRHTEVSRMITAGTPLPIIGKITG
jgi:integrase